MEEALGQAERDGQCRVWLNDLAGDGIAGALSTWERGFLQSVRGRLSWTERQHFHIQKIWREKSRAARDAVKSA